MKNPQQLNVEHSTVSPKTNDKFSKNIFKYGFTMMFAALAILSSCKKDGSNENSPSLKLNNGLAVEIPLSNADTGTIDQLGDCHYIVRNFNQGTFFTGDTSTAPGSKTFYFSLQNNDGGTFSTSSGPGHDIMFTGTANGDIYANAEPGYELKYIDRCIADVECDDYEDATAAYNGYIGMNSSNFPFITPPGGGGKGWYEYLFTPCHVVQPISTCRTILVKTPAPASKVYAIRMISIYKGGSPIGCPATNYPYFHFEYKLICGDCE